MERGNHGGSRGVHVTNVLGKGSGWRQSKQNQAPHAVAVYCLRLCGPDRWSAHDTQLLFEIAGNIVILRSFGSPALQWRTRMRSPTRTRTGMHGTELVVGRARSLVGSGR